MMCLGLVQDGHVPVLLEFRQVAANQVAELVHGVVALVDRLPEAVKNLFGLVIEKLNQNIVLVFEIEIDGAVGDTGFPGYLGNGGLKKSLLGKYLDGRFQDTLIFVVGLSLFVDGAPPLDTHVPPHIRKLRIYE